MSNDRKNNSTPHDNSKEVVDLKEYRRTLAPHSTGETTAHNEKTHVVSIEKLYELVKQADLEYEREHEKRKNKILEDEIARRKENYGIGEENTLSLLRELENLHKQTILEHMQKNWAFSERHHYDYEIFFRTSTPVETLVHLVNAQQISIVQLKKDITNITVQPRETPKIQESKNSLGKTAIATFLSSVFALGAYENFKKSDTDPSDHLEEAHASCNTMAKPEIARCVEDFMNTNYSDKTNDYKGLSEVFLTGADGSTIRLKIAPELSCRNDAEGDVSCSEHLRFTADKALAL